MLKCFARQCHTDVGSQTPTTRASYQRDQLTGGITKCSHENCYTECAAFEGIVKCPLYVGRIWVTLQWSFQKLYPSDTVITFPAYRRILQDTTLKADISFPLILDMLYPLVWVSSVQILMAIAYGPLVSIHITAACCNKVRCAPHLPEREEKIYWICDRNFKSTQITT